MKLNFLIEKYYLLKQKHMFESNLKKNRQKGKKGKNNEYFLKMFNLI